MEKDIIIEEHGRGGIVLYQSPDGQTRLDVKLENETVWLTQAQIAMLFDVQQPAISKHLKNIFNSGELDKDSVYSILEYTATDGKKYQTAFYNLDAILSVGYRVSGTKATIFRRWASTVLKDYLVKGYAVRSNLLQERYDELKALVDTMGRTIQYLDEEPREDGSVVFQMTVCQNYELEKVLIEYGEGVKELSQINEEYSREYAGKGTDEQ